MQTVTLALGAYITILTLQVAQKNKQICETIKKQNNMNVIRKVIFLLLFGINFTITQAQNWDCIQANKKQFYINANNYLRGMRIDSVMGTAADTTYYPFKTTRIPTPYILTLDSTSGSWWGSRIIKDTLGDFRFFNYFHDTILIKPHAALGTTWLFYNDTSAIYFMASVTALGTLSIQGNTDSIKTISLQAYIGGNPLSNYPINNLKIVLSKTHGFQTAIDLFMFPYAPLDVSGITTCSDYYIKLTSLQAGFGPPNPANNMYIDTIQQFHLVDFHYPFAHDIFNFVSGDILKTYRSHYDELNNYETTYTAIDTVLTKTTSAMQVVYYTHEKGEATTENNIGLPNYHITYTSYYYPTDSLVYNDSLIFDTTKMPEESFVPYAYYYNPGDTTDCFESASYEADDYSLKNTAVIPVSFEECGFNAFKYKAGIGIKTYFSVGGYPIMAGGNGCIIDDANYSACVKNGIACGSCYIVHTPLNVRNNQNLRIYPIPFTHQLLISGLLPESQLIVYDLLGRTFCDIKVADSQINLNTTSWPIGTYVVCIVQTDGSRLIKKLLKGSD